MVYRDELQKAMNLESSYVKLVEREGEQEGEGPCYYWSLA